MTFSYHIASTQDDALRRIADAGVLPVAGGTDLVPCTEEGILAPTLVVDIRRIPALRDISATAGGLRIGAAATIAELAAHDAIRARFPVLAEACGSVGTPALRNSGSLGGNLVQRHHCWYFRRGVGCFKRGGTQCAAVEGEHQYHGIVADGTCRAVHPSDPAVALLALDARVEIVRADGRVRHVDIAALYDGASRDPLKEAQLEPGELIVAVHLPAIGAAGAQHWEKVMQRGAWDFALVSVAACRRTDGSVRMAMGGLGLAPWRVPDSIEEDVASGGLDEDSIDALVERAFYDMEPLSGNDYKRVMGQGVLKRAIQAISAD
ncbi:FAD binding domain-containing protein [Pseudogemmatithrix spongiicola]|uniref:FAD binding domain-containing protein n=1 Tax=Pseudogemmatithrix spongiicola TaxID=3062599 RepID=A0AA49Q5N7_9BACT|nr:FAD binding domain-containing protein [Gemmatimonadaceae bacterium 'strain 138']WKW16345.1 FAD binding domain-containing protein [Gemmatimonadaceae bacterium 'strain 318']